MAIERGSRIGPYEVVEMLGAGGMGVVYRARDLRLSREVALKLVSDRLNTDPARVGRFEQEARAAGQLDHPNVLAVHDVGIHGGVPYIVTEFLEGESLRSVIALGSLSVRKSVEYARQICAGLAAAHDRGIVHNDIKPDNLFITRDGRVKILDFGIAELTRQADHATRTSATDTAGAGSGCGTPHYMSPEQLQGKPVDSRSDLFALGAVLYELLTSRRAFSGETAAEAAVAILKEAPAPIPDRPELPPALHAIVQRCLEKNPTERFQSARDLAFALKHVWTEAPSRSSSEPARVSGSKPAAAAAAVAVAAFAFAAGWWVHGGQPSTVAAPAQAFRQLTDLPGIERSPSVSPDGTTVVYESDAAGNLDIYSLRVGGRNPVNLTADSADADTTPMLSPNGSQIAFRSERAGGGIFVMGVTGESVRRVTDFGYEPSWSPDGSRLVVSSIGGTTPYERTGTGELSIVVVATGERRRLDIPFDAVQPRWSPLGRHIVFWAVERGTGRRDIWTVTADGPGVPVKVTSDAAVDWNPVWASDGRHLLFASDRGGVMNLWRVAIDERTGQASGDPEPMTVPAASLNGFSLSNDNQIVFASADVRTALVRLEFNPAQEAVTSADVLFESPRIYRSPDWSPDGETLVFSTFGSAENLHVIRADGSGYRQLTDDSFRNRGPRWFPDGTRVLFYSSRGGTYQAWSIRSDGSGPQQLTDTPASVVRPLLSPNGDRIAYRPSLGSRWSIAELHAPGAERITDVAPAPAGANPTPNSWSPDGSKIALFEVFPGGAAPRMFVYHLSSQQYQLLPVSGAHPVWLPDGRRLLFLTRRGVDLIDTDTKRTQQVYAFAPELATQGAGIALTADGRRMALLVLNEKSDLWMLSTQPAQARN